MAVEQGVGILNSVEGILLRFPRINRLAVIR